MIPNNFPFQKEILKHKYNFPTHTSFSITGTNKQEKIYGAYCNECKKYITLLKVVS